jgi:hypothetical protein
MKTWLKGGLIGMVAIFPIIIISLRMPSGFDNHLILLILQLLTLPLLYIAYFDFLSCGILSISGNQSCWVAQVFLGVIITLIIYFIVGAVIGQVYGKFREKKK